MKIIFESTKHKEIIKQLRANEKEILDTLRRYVNENNRLKKRIEFLSEDGLFNDLLESLETNGITFTTKNPIEVAKKLSFIIKGK